MANRYEKSLSLDGLKLEKIRVDGMYAVSTPIRNGQGQHIGKFVTNGVGMEEHHRRLKGLVKRTIKCEKEQS